MPCSAMKSSGSQHCSGMTSVPASATREADVINGDLLVGGSERDVRLTGVCRSTGCREPELSCASRPSVCHSCI